MNKTATVEVLTANVRVLAVGSRQVTLSVFRQLDWILPDTIIPFGRVHDPQSVKAFPTGEPGEHFREENTHGVVLTVGSGPRGDLVRSMVWIDDGSTETVDEIYDEWLGLPLIVLAGLR